MVNIRVKKCLRHGKCSSWFTNKAGWDYFSAVLFLWSSMVLLKKDSSTGATFRNLSKHCMSASERQKHAFQLYSIIIIFGRSKQRSIRAAHVTRHLERNASKDSCWYRSHASVSISIDLTSDGWHFFIATFSDGRFVLKTLTGREPSPKTPRWFRADT